MLSKSISKYIFWLFLILNSSYVFSRTVALDCTCRLLTAKIAGSKNQACNSKSIWIFDENSNFFDRVDNFNKEKFFANKKDYFSNTIAELSKKEAAEVNPRNSKIATESSVQFNNSFISAEKKSNIFFSVMWAHYDFRGHELRISRGSGHIIDTVDYYQCQELE